MPGSTRRDPSAEWAARNPDVITWARLLAGEGVDVVALLEAAHAAVRCRIPGTAVVNVVALLEAAHAAEQRGSPENRTESGERAVQRWIYEHREDVLGGRGWTRSLPRLLGDLLPDKPDLFFSPTLAGLLANFQARKVREPRIFEPVAEALCPPRKRGAARVLAQERSAGEWAEIRAELLRVRAAKGRLPHAASDRHYRLVRLALGERERFGGRVSDEALALYVWEERRATRSGPAPLTEARIRKLKREWKRRDTEARRSRVRKGRTS